MRILVTGGSGYIGSVLVPALLAEGWHVTVLGTFRRDGASLASSCANPLFNAVRGDGRDERTLIPLLRKADAIIPLAALVGAPLCAADTIGAETTNRIAVELLARSAAPGQVIIYPNTNSGYGVGGAAACDEDAPLNPVSLYGQTKCGGERAVLDRRNGIALRLATVFGMSPRMRLDLLVNDFVHRAVNDRAVVLFEAGFRRNYIHVRDVAAAFVHALKHSTTMRGRPYNLGLSDANLTKRELCDVIARHVPGFVAVESPIGEDPDKRDYIISNARIEATGWRANYSLDDGIRELVKGFRMLRNSRFSNV